MGARTPRPIWTNAVRQRNPTRQVMFCAITSSFVLVIMDIDDLIVS